MLKWLSTDLELGLYSVASRISEIWYVLPAAVLTAFLPSLTRYKKFNPERYTSLLRMLLSVSLYTSIVICIIIYFFAEFFIGLLFGPSYTDATSILIIHILASIFFVPRLVFSKWIIIEKLERFSLITQISGAVVNVILNLFFIPYYGAQGAAIATCVAYATAGLFILFCFKDTRQFLSIYYHAILILSYSPKTTPGERIKK